MYWLNDGSGFKSLKIVDNNVFSTLTAYTKMISNTKIDCSWMDICIGTLCENNLINQLIFDFYSRLSMIKSYMKENYGIIIDFTEAKFKTLEINTTIELDAPFASYHRVFRIFMYNLPARFKQSFEALKYDRIQYVQIVNGFYRFNKSMGIKIYDKSGYTQKYYMRLEFVLKTSKKISESLGTNLIYHITDEMILNYFTKQFTKLFVRAYSHWQENNRCYLTKLLDEHKHRNRITWKKSILQECSDREQRCLLPVLLDIQNLLKIVKIQDKNRHFARDRRRFLSYKEGHSVYFQDDAKKASEVLSKIQKICDAPSD